MATLVFSAIGTALGGPLGGAIGALIGRQADGVIFGNGRTEGPRVQDLAVTTSTYGSAIPRVFGRMRMPGSIVWSTDLVEHRAMQQAKNRPSTTTYSYTVSFAVALSSRPIGDVGRIWADGNLLRGTAGDLKVAGTLRIHKGTHDQAPDPLIASAEGAGRCPAYRGLAYVVFEDLDLSEFYNRVPTLTFEVLADSGEVSLVDIVSPLIANVDAAVDLPALLGLACEGPLLDTLQLLDPYFPIACDAAGDQLTFGGDRLQSAALTLDEAAVSVRDDDFGSADGFARKRGPLSIAAPEVLRYYDIGRDYLTGSQRAQGRAGPGQPRTIELPAAMTAQTARALVERVARQSDWSRDTLMWRTAELDGTVSPGSSVVVPNQPGLWRVDEWEWRDTGVELSLTRMTPQGAETATIPVDAGRISESLDVIAGPTLLNAFELPWDGTGLGDAPTIVAAVSSASAGWKGAALFLDRGDGNLISLGASGRGRSIVGVTQGVLPSGNPLLIDRGNTLVVKLADETMTLANADGRLLAAGANRALVGGEIIQFAFATPTGTGVWRLTGLLRGRGGTESAIWGHLSAEPFVLLDDALFALDGVLIGNGPATVVAEGLGDHDAVTSAIGLRGVTRRPLVPVRARKTALDSGALFEWTRRARGAWTWDDGVDAPLHEEFEAYVVTLGDIAAPAATWTVAQPRLMLDSATLTKLRGLLPAGVLRVRQQGSYAMSEPLVLATLS